MSGREPPPVVFDEEYYRRVIADYGYSPLEFSPIDFGLGILSRDLTRRRWLCHKDGTAFAAAQPAKKIVTTGFGLSGVPHVGTISQMLGAVLLQQAGFRVQIVLGDLDAYNARGQDLTVLHSRASQYRRFIEALGFDSTAGIIRTQYDFPDLLRAAYLYARYLDDADFQAAEEDLSQFYVSRGIYPGISFPVKQAILLMVTDFVSLGNAFSDVLVMLGVDEHRYVRLSRVLVERANLPLRIAAIYSRMNRGLRGYPKMSKSVPGSAITADMSRAAIQNAIETASEATFDPMESPVYQMMLSTSYYSAEELDELSAQCRQGGDAWRESTRSYAKMLADICERWCPE